MSKSKPSASAPRIPRYLRHRSRDRAYVYLRTPEGRRRQVYLPGAFDSPESHRRYRELVASYLLDPGAPNRPVSGTTAEADPTAVLVTELAARFPMHAEGYYCKGDKPTGEVTAFQCAVRPLLMLYRDEPAAAEFSPRKLEQVRSLMVENGWSRPYVNAQTARILRVFKFAVSQELVPASVYQALSCVAGLRRGRSQAREPDRILPVEWDVVEETLPHLPPTIAAMVLFAWHREEAFPARRREGVSHRSAPVRLRVAIS